MSAISRWSAVVIGIAFFAVGVFGIGFTRDAPVKKVIRVFTDSPRCLVCNCTASTSRTYYDVFTAEQESEHFFCYRHHAPEEVWSMIWPEIDKYILIGLSLVMFTGGLLASSCSVMAALDDDVSLAFLSPWLFYAGGIWMNNFSAMVL